MQRDVRLIADYPAVVAGFDVEHDARLHLPDPAVVHGRGRTARDHHPDMLDRAALRSCSLANMLRPLPPRLIGGAANCHAANVNQFKLALLKYPHFVGLLKTFQDDFVQGRSPLEKLLSPRLGMSERREEIQGLMRGGKGTLACALVAITGWLA